MRRRGPAHTLRAMLAFATPVTDPDRYATQGRRGIDRVAPAGSPVLVRHGIPPVSPDDRARTGQITGQAQGAPTDELRAVLLARLANASRF